MANAGPRPEGLRRDPRAGLTEAWAAASETTVEIVDRLLAEGVEGGRIALQLHGNTDLGLVTRLINAGAKVQQVPVYRWGPSPDPQAVQRAIEATCLRTVDAVVCRLAEAPDGPVLGRPIAGVAVLA